MQEKPDEIDQVLNEDTQIPIEVEPIVRKSFLSRLLKSILKFLNKYKWVIIGVFVAIISLFIALYNLISVIAIDNVKLVNLDSVVEIKNGQIIKNKSQNVSVKLSNFVNETCPQGRKCFGDGAKSVEYIVTVDGKGYATGSLSDETISGYKIKTIDSDYKSYANIKILKVN